MPHSQLSLLSICTGILADAKQIRGSGVIDGLDCEFANGLRADEAAFRIRVCTVAAKGPARNCRAPKGRLGQWQADRREPE
jgi:hypothetical protein